MPETPNSDTPAVNEPKPPAGAPTNQPTPPAGDGDSPADEPLTLETKKKLDKENKQLRRERDEAQAALKKRQDAELSEVERLTNKVKEYEGKESAWAAEKRERDARDSILAVLSDESADNKYRAKNSRAVYKYIKDDLEYSDDGKVTNLSDLLRKAKAEAPELFQGKPSASADGGLGSGNNGTIDMNQRIRQAAGHTR